METENIGQIVTTEDAKALVEKGEAKFLSYGYDQRFFFLYKDRTYANREQQYELLGGLKNETKREHSD